MVCARFNLCPPCRLRNLRSDAPNVHLGSQQNNNNSLRRSTSQFVGSLMIRGSCAARLRGLIAEAQTRPSILDVTRVVAIPSQQRYRGFERTCARCMSTDKSKTRRSDRQQRRQQNHEQAEPDLSLPLSALQTGLSEGSITRVIDNYESVRRKLEFGIDDTYNIVNCLYSNWKTAPKSYSSKTKLFGRQLLVDIQARALPPNPKANARMMHYLRASDELDLASKFWTWLSKQGDEHVNFNVMAAAIDAFTDMGKPLSFMEEIYAGALKRFPDSFIEYHVSENAKLSAFMPADFPRRLMRAITRARLSRNDARSAYLMLDTNLRLHPMHMQVQDFEHFIQQRPVMESYSLYLLSCSYDAVNPQPNLVIPVFRSLRMIAKKGIKEYLHAARAGISVLFASACAGHTMKSQHFSEIAMLYLHVLLTPECRQLNTSKREEIADIVLSTTAMLERYFQSWDVEPNASLLNTMILAFGAGAQRRDKALESLHRLGLLLNETQFSEVTCRTLLQVSEALQDKQILDAAWRNLQDKKIANGAQIAESEMYLYAKAATRCNRDLALIAAELSEHSTAEDQVDTILSNVADLAARQAEPVPESELASTAAEMKDAAHKLEQDVKVLVALCGPDKDRNPSLVTRIPWTLAKDESSAPASEEAMRGLYDALVAAPRDEGTAPSKEDERRYENWKVMNHVLAQREWLDKHCLGVAHGGVPRKDLPLHDQSVGLSDVFTIPGQEVPGEKPAGTAGRSGLSVEDVKRLRGLV
ncbi:hypothetical protein ANO11243_043820 [Dothideomycetidae sp. 11243]|nr:hypothetical protein ANO11243_043820 [fungal sp. No.11243]